MNLTVAARPENLAVIRQALAGYAEAMGFDPDAVADLKTIVTEASMNAVVHAYPDDAPGPLEVSAWPHGEGIEIAVRDHGSGFKPPADREDPGLRLGLPLIATLSDQFEIRGGSEGTEVRMIVRPSVNGVAAEEAGEAIDPEEARGTVMSIEAGTFVRPVLARVISALAARADFSIDRLSDSILIGDAVSAHDASDFRDGTVGIEILDGNGRLDVRIGPLVEGGSERIMRGLELPGGASLRQLATEITVERAPSEGADEPAEFLLIGIDR